MKVFESGEEQTSGSSIPYQGLNVDTRSYV